MVPKFRAWDKNNKEMISWRYLLNGYNLRNVFMRPEMCGLELMQSTGLKDKNGAEIFEGDILTSNVQPCKMVNPIKDGYGVVRFENGMFKLGAISLVTFISKMEVVGNIYENPELLDQSNES